MLAEDLRPTHQAMLDGESQRRRQILEGKRLKLMEQLLAEAQHEDTDLIKDILNGFDLTGQLPESSVFKKKFRPATLHCSELRKIAATSRQAMLRAVGSSGDPELDQGLMEANLKEVNKGFILGPVSEAELPAGATLTRRFAVRQKNKIRPIDDYRASLVNSSVTQTEGVTVHAIDHIAAMIALWMRASVGSKKVGGLTAKCWDLSDAYKQLPLSVHAFEHDAYLVVFDPSSQGPCIYQQKVLPFGLIASVTSFLRLSLAIWKLGTSHLSLMWPSYFDDFMSLTEQGIERHTDMVIAFLFSTLGWRLSLEKLVELDAICKVLGAKVDLSDTHLGMAYMANTPERTAELLSELDSILKEGVLSRKDGERLRGRLQFASGQLFGRLISNHLKKLSDHIRVGRRSISPELRVALDAIKLQVSQNVPRRVSGRLSKYVHVYIDASFEPDWY
eukprot:s4522_g1.t1